MFKVPQSKLSMFILMLPLVFTLSSCATAPIKNGQSQWDFDHHVQFKQSRINDHKYHLVVNATNKTDFSVLATFLMRRSLQLCKSYGFKIEVLAGVETYDHKVESPNMLMASLAANVECPNP